MSVVNNVNPEGVPTKPNIKVNDMISVSLNVDNFKKYLDYLEEVNKKQNEEIKDLNFRVSKFDALERVAEEIMQKMESIETKIGDIDGTLYSHANKFLEIEMKSNTLTERIDNQLKEIGDKLNTHDTFLDRLDEESKNLNMNVEVMKDELSRMASQDQLSKVERENEEKMNKLREDTEGKFREVSASVFKFDNNFEKVYAAIEELKIAQASNKGFITGVDRRNTNNNMNIQNFEGSVHSNEINIEGDAYLGENINNNILSEIERGTNNTNEVNTFSGNNLNSESEKFRTTLRNQRRSIVNPTTHTNNTNHNINTNNNLLSDPNDQKDLSMDTDPLSRRDIEGLKKEFVNMKIVQQNNYFELQALITEVQAAIDGKNDDHKSIEDNNYRYTRRKSQRLDAHEIKDSIKTEVLDYVAEVVQAVEERLKSLELAYNEKQRDEKDFPEIDASLDMPMTNNRGEMNNMENNDVFNLDENIDNINSNNLQMQQISQLTEVTNKTKSDLAKCEDSLRELKRMYLDWTKRSKQVNNPTEEEKEALSGNYKEVVETRLTEVERNLIKLKGIIDETVGLKEEDKDEHKPQGEGSIKEIVKASAGNLKIVTDKVEKIQIKLDHVMTEILTKLKKDLSYDSQRVLEEFKVDLKMSILKLDDQIKEKVDKYNFDEYGRKIDYKISNEISKKLDKNELKKNNTMINRKIDNLETRISKTLVDTIIDLQVDEAPLIVKKGMHKDKCVSCNQVIHDDCNPLLNSLGKYNDLAERYKLKSLQEITNKLGLGSFSRILGNCEPESIKEDLEYSPSVKKKNLTYANVNVNTTTNITLNSNQISLPQINNTKGSENLNNIISEELDKKIIRGANLIKSVDRLYNEKK